MSLQMRVVHFCMGLVPPLLQSETATEQMALHAPQPAPMPARMRGRFTATCDKGITRVFPKRGQRAGGALIYLHGGAYVYPMVVGVAANLCPVDAEGKNIHSSVSCRFAESIRQVGAWLAKYRPNMPPTLSAVNSTPCALAAENPETHGSSGLCRL